MEIIFRSQSHQDNYLKLLDKMINKKSKEYMILEEDIYE
jgi:hypothetical protein